MINKLVMCNLFVKLSKSLPNLKHIQAFIQLPTKFQLQSNPSTKIEYLGLKSCSLLHATHSHEAAEQLQKRKHSY